MMDKFLYAYRFPHDKKRRSISLIWCTSFHVLLNKIKAKVYGISFIHACVFVYRGLK
jgi:hypothetical protein